MSDTIEVQASTEPPSQAVTVRDAVQALERTEPQAKPAMTAAQAKIDAVAAVTQTAYARASELKLSPEETAGLQKDFPDEAFKPGAAGKEQLIYIEHAFLRDRLNEVLGPGQWALIPRNRWGEDFSYQRQVNGKWTTVQGTRVYVEAMLMVRGCFVAEAVGEMEYYPKNAGANYGDAVEGAKTAALRRCCKEFGIGLQAWKKDWCAGWWERKKAGQRHPPTVATTTTKPEVKRETPQFATDKTRQWMIGQFGERTLAAEEYGQAVGILLPNETILDWPLSYVPMTKDQMLTLLKCVEAFEQGDETTKPFPPNPLPPEPSKQPAEKPATINVGAKPIEVPRDEQTFSDTDDPDSENAAWRAFEMPWGKQMGTPLGELDKKYLFGLWANYEVETEYNGKPKKPETIAKDQEFRNMLDAAGLHYGFKKDK